jgi:hypothetical protein
METQIGKFSNSIQCGTSLSHLQVLITFYKAHFNIIYSKYTNMETQIGKFSNSIQCVTILSHLQVFITFYKAHFNIIYSKLEQKTMLS